MRSIGPIPDDPFEAADWWVARHRLAFLTGRDQDVFERWHADPANEMAWRSVENKIEAIGRFAATPELMALRDAALAVEPQRWSGNWTRRLAWPALAASIAAAFLILNIVTGSTEWSGIENKKQGHFASNESTRHYATAIGERRSIGLPDGSTIMLNTGSALDVRYTDRQREVRLLSGQGMFKVAKDSTRPFIVLAADRKITATGTAFDVRLEGKSKVSVLLIEGKVTVDPAHKQGLAWLIPALDRERLNAGERLAAGSAEIVQVDRTDIDKGTRWTQGEVLFRQDFLSQAVDEMNRYSAEHIVIDDPRVASIRISGVFKAGSSRNFVDAITGFYPIVAERRGPNEIALKWRGHG